MLDPAGRHDVLGIVRTLHDTGTTIVTITHQMEEGLHADRIVVLHHGNIALAGTPRQVFTDPVQLRNLKLDLPPSALLAHKIHRVLPAFPTDCLTPAELANAVRRQLAEAHR